MRSFAPALCAAVALFGVVRPAAAWNAVGHMVVGRLAYEQLSTDERRRVDELLANHPHFGQYLSTDRPAEIDAGAWAVMRAGVWPDWIRPPRRFDGDARMHPIHRFHRGPWHYVNFPYVAHQPSDALPAEAIAAGIDILRVLPRCVQFGGATDEPDSDAETGLTAAQNRAVRLCWLIHLVGDLHQPLHAASLVDAARLPGADHHDQGGNLLAVRTEIGAAPTRLHSFWDQLPGTDNHPATVVRLADELARDPTLQRDRLTELDGDADFRRWAAESYAASVRDVYLNGDLPIVVWDDSRPILPATDEAPILPVGYERRARETARRRLAVAGYRLAELLRAVSQ